jgi:hypothetical protein
LSLENALLLVLLYVMLHGPGRWKIQEEPSTIGTTGSFELCSKDYFNILRVLWSILLNKSSHEKKNSAPSNQLLSAIDHYLVQTNVAAAFAFFRTNYSFIMEAQQHRDYTEEGLEGAMEVRLIRRGILKKWSFARLAAYFARNVLSVIVFFPVASLSYSFSYPWIFFTHIELMMR